MNEELFAYYAEPPKRNLWRRVIHRLFPARYCPLPEAPATYKDCIHFRCVVMLDWKDRLRTLASGRLEVNAKIVTEHEVGATISGSVAYPQWRSEGTTP